MFFMVAGLFLGTLFCVNILQKAGLRYTKKIAIRLTRYFSAIVLKVFSIKVRAQLNPRVKPCLYVCNHLSYLDAIAVFSQIDAVFITSTEMRDAPGLGALCKMGNCLFVDREQIWNLPHEIEAITRSLKAGFSVVLFPEGTTSAGHYLKEFKSPLLQAAVDAQCQVVPLALNFSKFHKRSPLLEDRDYYCWYGTMEFLPHLFRLCTIKSIEVTLTELTALRPKAVAGYRKTLTRRSKSLINDHFRPIEITH